MAIAVPGRLDHFKLQGADRDAISFAHLGFDLNRREAILLRVQARGLGGVQRNGALVQLSEEARRQIVDRLVPLLIEELKPPPPART